MLSNYLGERVKIDAVIKNTSDNPKLTTQTICNFLPLIVIFTIDLNFLLVLKLTLYFINLLHEASVVIFSLLCIHLLELLAFDKFHAHVHLTFTL